jgi:preprotein translocase subunit SecB
MENPQKARLFPANLEFVNVSRARFSASVIPPLRSDRREELPTPEGWEFELSYHPAGDQRYLVKLSVTAVFHVEEPPYEVSVELTAGIRASRGVEESLITRWLEEGVQYVLSPYAREAVSALVGQGGFPVPHFPLLTVPVLHAGEGDETGEDHSEE